MLYGVCLFYDEQIVEQSNRIGFFYGRSSIVFSNRSELIVLTDYTKITIFFYILPLINTLSFIETNKLGDL